MALQNSPLFRARESLVTNYIVVLLKRLLVRTNDYKENMRISAALNAVYQMRKNVFDSTLKEKLSVLFRTVEDKDFDLTFYFLRNLPECWEYLDLDVKQKLLAYTELLPKEYLDEINYLLGHSELSASATRRIRSATREDLAHPWFSELAKPLANRIVQLYVESASYEQANSFSSTIMMCASDFSKEQVEKIVRACGENGQIRESLQVGNIIGSMRKNNNVSDTEIDHWLLEVGITDYVQI